MGFSACRLEGHPLRDQFFTPEREMRGDLGIHLLRQGRGLPFEAEQTPE
jgi:hypothetical protein